MELEFVPSVMKREKEKSHQSLVWNNFTNGVSLADHHIIDVFGEEEISTSVIRSRLTVNEQVFHITSDQKHDYYANQINFQTINNEEIFFLSLEISKSTTMKKNVGTRWKSICIIV